MGEPMPEEFRREKSLLDGEGCDRLSNGVTSTGPLGLVRSVFENLLPGGRIAVLLCWGLSDVMVRQALAFWSVAGANGSACPVWVMMVSSMDTSDGLLLQPGAHVAYTPGRDLGR